MILTLGLAGSQSEREMGTAGKDRLNELKGDNERNSLSFVVSFNSLGKIVSTLQAQAVAVRLALRFDTPLFSNLGPLLSGFF